MNDERKIPTRTDDPLEVGFARYQKTSSKMPIWAIEHGAKITLGLVFFALVVSLFCLNGGLFEEGTEDLPRATIELLHGPAKVWEEGEVDMLRSVRVIVGNRSTVDATGVKVSVHIGRNRYTLEGATAIPSGKSGEYQGVLMVRCPTDAPIEVHWGCTNCGD